MTLKAHFLLLLVTSVFSAVTLPKPGPRIDLEFGSFLGTNELPGVSSFLGLPYARAGRFENPVLISKEHHQKGLRNATVYPPQCPQGPITGGLGPSSLEILPILEDARPVIGSFVASQTEDCLTINVQVPKGTRPNDKLPVLFWIHGGGFSAGSGAIIQDGAPLKTAIYQAGNLVKHSVKMKRPMIVVAANYRLGFLGFSASEEITEAGVSNLGLKDQRMAMRWVKKYISKFGGDPEKVTLMGESAGSMSIATHLVLNGGDNEGLFRGAIMHSGGILKLKDYREGQVYFDQAVEVIGCPSSGDKLACLKNASFSEIQDLMQQFPPLLFNEELNIPWFPRPDGQFLKDSPHSLIRNGNLAKVPFIIYDVEDEGTLFALLPQLNVNDNQQFKGYINATFSGTLGQQEIRNLAQAYPDDLSDGSPYHTGSTAFLGPQYKRLASFIGDTMFQAGRRDLLKHASPKQRVYTALIVQDSASYSQLPVLGNLSDLVSLGSFHTSDSGMNMFGTIPPNLKGLSISNPSGSRNSLYLMSITIAFTNSLNPNAHGLPHIPQWPTWNIRRKAMMRFSETDISIMKDTFREDAMDFQNNLPDLYMV